MQGSDVSVAVCTHNPRPDFLARVIEGLAGQDYPTELWDLVIVDNASSKPVAESIDLSWHPQARVIREPRLGIGYARVRAVQETSAQLVVFVDDDNMLDKAYLRTAERLASDWPRLGAFGAGEVVPEFETPPQEWCGPYLSLLSLRSLSCPRWSNSPEDSAATPFGAGMCVRRDVADHYRAAFEGGAGLRSFGAKGKGVSSVPFGGGEDELMAWSGRELGYGWGNFPELKLLHLIPASRVSEEYLFRVVERQARLGVSLLYAATGKVTRPYGSIASKVKRAYHNGRFLLTGRFRERRAYEAHIRGVLAGQRELARALSSNVEDAIP
jgi:glycosyltransferase involved in cell wall biosynthesis